MLICPLCQRTYNNLVGILYPNGVTWEYNPDIGKIYGGKAQYTNSCYIFSCKQGCGMELTRDTYEEVMDTLKFYNKGKE